jgi:hypothetical protein
MLPRPAVRRLALAPSDQPPPTVRGLRLRVSKLLRSSLPIEMQRCPYAAVPQFAGRSSVPNRFEPEDLGPG